MFSLLRRITAGAIAVSLFSPADVDAWPRCRNQPSNPGYPTNADWSALNDTMNGRLINVVPSAKACHQLGCTEDQWESGVFRQTIPGSMNSVRSPTLSLSSLIIFFACIVQLGTGELSSVALSFLSSHGNSIITLPLNCVYVTAPPVLKEMSLFMQSTQQTFNIFRFTPLLAMHDHRLPLSRLESDLPRPTTCVSLSNPPVMMYSVVLLRDIHSSSGRLTSRISPLRNISTYLAQTRDPWLLLVLESA
jgi:hypothetical protein